MRRRTRRQRDVDGVAEVTEVDIILVRAVGEAIEVGIIIIVTVVVIIIVTAVIEGSLGGVVRLQLGLGEVVVAGELALLPADVAAAAVALALRLLCSLCPCQLGAGAGVGLVGCVCGVDDFGVGDVVV